MVGGAYQACSSLRQGARGDGLGCDTCLGSGRYYDMRTSPYAATLNPSTVGQPLICRPSRKITIKTQLEATNLKSVFAVLYLPSNSFMNFVRACLSSSARGSPPRRRCMLSLNAPSTAGRASARGRALDVSSINVIST